MQRGRQLFLGLYCISQKLKACTVMAKQSRSETWAKILASMRHCNTCIGFSSSPFAVVRPPPKSFRPPNPKGRSFGGRIRVLFVSEAPPGGKHYGDFFWTDERERDGLRSQLLKACHAADLIAQETLKSFKSAGFYLLPTVPAATQRMGEYNENPSSGLLKHSATSHLARAMEYIKPERVFLLGESALDGAYHTLGSRSPEFKRDFESRRHPLRKILRENSPYSVTANLGAFGLYCSYWPRNGGNYRRTVEDLKRLRRDIARGVAHR